MLLNYVAQLNLKLETKPSHPALGFQIHMLHCQLSCQTLLTHILLLYYVPLPILRTKVVETVLLLILCTGFPNTHAALSAQLAKGVNQYPFSV